MKVLTFLLFFFITTLSCAQVFDTLILLEEQTILFESDEWDLNSDGIKNLESILSSASISDSVILEGHTDAIGSLEYNQNLSQKRVSSIKAYLLQLKIDENKIISNAFGELKPIETGSSKSAYQMNRRVSIKCYQNQARRIIIGRVIDKENGEGLKAKVLLTGRDFKDSILTEIDGDFSFSAPDNAVYKLDVIAEGHFFNQRFIKISPIEPVEINIELPKPKIGDKFVLPNFNFKPGLPILLKKSVPTLELLYETLAHSAFCAEIKGHINEPNMLNINTATTEYILSVNRADMVYNHMIDKGISPKRMLPRGYGNWEMLYPKTRKESEMVKNRRVEIVIINCESDELLSKK